MPLNGSIVNDQFAASAGATDNLTAACRGILDTKIAPSSSHWYGTLNGELAQAQALATQWNEQYATRFRSDVLTCVVHCGQGFQQEREQIHQLFAQAQQDLAGGTKAALQNALAVLKQKSEMISSTVSTYEAGLKSWGQSLEQVHQQFSATVHQVQNEEAALRAQINAINATMANLQAEINKDRQEIARAKRERDKGTIETIFGVIFAPFTGGLSLILAGIGVSSIVEAESKVSAMESTIGQYQAQIVANQQNLNQDQVQVATLQGLTLSAGIALHDIEFGEQMLDAVRTTWDAFFQEMDGVIAKIGKAEDAAAIALEQVWFEAACGEWDLVVAGAQGLIGAPVDSSRSVTCGHCDVPVLRVVPTGSHPAVPPDLKITVLTGPKGTDLAPNCQVLMWGEYTYWVASYMDNREAVCFLAYDSSNQVVRQVAKSGARYPWKLVLDDAQQSLRCYGQAGASVTVPLAELQVT